MKKFLALGFAILSVGGLSACVYHDHHPAHPHGKGGFCPPGQAKKGNC